MREVIALMLLLVVAGCCENREGDLCDPDHITLECNECGTGWQCNQDHGAGRYRWVRAPDVDCECFEDPDCEDV